MSHTPLFQSFIRILRQAQYENLKADGIPIPQPTAPSHKSGHWTRRRLLKSAALAGGTALTTGLSSGLQQAWGQSPPRIVIIGAGIAGLNAAYQLKKVGLTATIYEARNRVGGRMLSVTGAVGNGLVTDLGGSFINQDHEDMLSLVKEFDLSLFNRIRNAEQLPFPEVGYYFNDRVRPEVEVAERLRPLARQIANDAGLLDENFDEAAPLFDNISISDYLDTHRNKILDPFIRELIENIARTEYGVEPDQCSAIQLLFSLPTVERNEVEVLGGSDETFVVQGGSGRIVEGLAQALLGQIELRKRLTRIQSRRTGYHLKFADNSTVDADYVIIAIPFKVLRTVDILVNLPATLRKFISEANLGFNEKLFAGFNQKAWRRNTGFVTEAWTDLGFSEVWDETQRQSNRTNGALTFYFGGDEVKAVQSGNVNAQGRRVVDKFDTFIPGARTAANDQFLRTAWTTDPFTRGGYTNFKPGQYLKFGEFLYIESDDPEERQDVNVGNLAFAGEHLSDEFYGYMNGGAQTGRLAAETVLRIIQEG
jgi:monoamine oxidase